MPSVLPDTAAPRRPARWRGLRQTARSLQSRPSTLLSLAFLVLLLGATVAAPWIAPHDPNVQELGVRLPPGGNAEYLLGTDHLGRDLLSRLIYGGRLSLLVAITSVLIAGLLGTLLGLFAGYLRGWVDEIIGFGMDVQLAIPFILLAIAVIAALGGGVRNLILVFGITGWVLYARIVRAEALVIRQHEFIEASRAIGAGGARIVFRHVLPNLGAPLIILTTFDLARLLILEASMSFLGLGVEPGTPSWGTMLADGRNYLTSAWWVATLPGIAITLAVLAVNIIGDWLRDRLDPRLQL